MASETSQAVGDQSRLIQTTLLGFDGKTPVSVDMPKWTHSDTSIRSRVAQYIVIKATNPNITQADIARTIGISVSSLQGYLYKARKEGWITFEDPLNKLEYEIIPKVVENLNHFLDAKDKQVTIETAKGTLFKSYQESKGISDAPKTVLAIKLETPEGEVQIVSGHIVGKPREV